MWAAYLNKIDIVKYLVNHKSIDINLVNENRRNALHFAVLKPKKKSNNVNDKSNNVNNNKKTEEVVQLLLDKGILKDIPDINGNTPISLAIKNKYLNIILLLVKNHVTLSKKNIEEIKKLNNDELITRLIKIINDPKPTIRNKIVVQEFGNKFQNIYTNQNKLVLELYKQLPSNKQKRVMNYLREKHNSTGQTSQPSSPETQQTPSILKRLTGLKLFSGGNMQHKYNGRTYKVRVGPKGGKYILVNKQKKYL